MSYDAVVVGASIAGCTAATLLARRGARVAIVDSHSDPAAFKRSCTHTIQASAVPTIERLGARAAIEDAGGVRTPVELWTRFGWVVGGADQPNLNIRREKLDPLLRSLAAETDGVDLLLGHRVEGIASEEGRATGVDAVARDGAVRRIAARLVVAADGRDSRVAELVGVRPKVASNGRFAAYAYYRDLPLARGRTSQIWFLDPDVAYAFPNDDGLTLLAAFPARTRLDEFDADRPRALEALFDGVPRRPPIEAAERMSPVLGRKEMPNVSRPAALSGIGLVGDAALASDPTVGVGCGWALQSAEWLVEEVAGPLLDGADLDAALKAYRRRHHRALAPHQALIAQGSKCRSWSSLEAALMAAATKDQVVADRFAAYSSRRSSPREFYGPRNALRALWVGVTRRRRDPGEH